MTVLTTLRCALWSCADRSALRTVPIWAFRRRAHDGATRFAAARSALVRILLASGLAFGRRTPGFAGLVTRFGRAALVIALRLTHQAGLIGTASWVHIRRHFTHLLRILIEEV